MKKKVPNSIKQTIDYLITLDEDGGIEYIYGFIRFCRQCEFLGNFFKTLLDYDLNLFHNSILVSILIGSNPEKDLPERKLFIEYLKKFIKPENLESYDGLI